MKDFIDFLVQEGWTQNDNKYVKNIAVNSNSVMIVNGKQMELPQQTVEYTIEPMGEGAIDDTPLYFFIFTSPQGSIEVSFYDVDEFKKFFSK